MACPQCGQAMMNKTGFGTFLALQIGHDLFAIVTEVSSVQESQKKNSTKNSKIHSIATAKYRFPFYK
jgi:primosomal protein N'